MRAALSAQQDKLAADGVVACADAFTPPSTPTSERVQAPAPRTPMTPKFDIGNQAVDVVTPTNTLKATRKRVGTSSLSQKARTPLTRGRTTTAIIASASSDSTASTTSRAATPLHETIGNVTAIEEDAEKDENSSNGNTSSSHGSQMSTTSSHSGSQPRERHSDPEDIATREMYSK